MMIKIILGILSYFFLFTSTLADNYQVFSRVYLKKDINGIFLVIEPKAGYKVNFDCDKRQNIPVMKLISSENFNYQGLEYDNFCLGEKKDYILGVRYNIPQENKEFNANFELDFTLCGEKNSCFIEKAFLQVSSRGDTGQEMFYLAILSALLGGVILNFMPCVLPVLALKIASFAKLREKSKSIVQKKSTASFFGIIFCYFLIGILTCYFKSIGENFGYNFFFQNSHFIILICIALIIFASGLLGRSLFRLPYQLNTILHNFSNKHGLLGDFFTGCFASVMSTPCTAPFLTVAMAFAMAATYFQVIVIFLSIGVGLALPYLILIFFPKIVHIFPKPGLWQDKFNRGLAILVYLSFFGFVYVLYTQIGFMSTVVLFLLMILLKFFIEIKWKSSFKWLIVLLIIGMSITLPFVYNKEEKKIEELYDSVWHKFNLKDIENKVNEGRVVLIDITASWCATCQINKFFILNNPLMLEFFIKENIYLVRYEAHNELEKEVKQLMAKFKRFGIPTDIIYGPKIKEGKVLQPLLSIDNLKHELEIAK